MSNAAQLQIFRVHLEIFQHGVPRPEDHLFIAVSKNDAVEQIKIHCKMNKINPQQIGFDVLRLGPLDWYTDQALENLHYKIQPWSKNYLKNKGNNEALREENAQKQRTWKSLNSKIER